MKKLFVASFLLVFSAVLFAQVDFGFRANALSDVGSFRWEDVNSREISQRLEEKIRYCDGFNVGLSLKFSDVLTTPFFLMPEVYYTFLGSGGADSDGVRLKAKTSRVDVPFLVGIYVLRSALNAFVGPVVSYALSERGQHEGFREDVSAKLHTGYQVGLNFEISRIIVNFRYEGAFSQYARSYVNEALGRELWRYNRPGLLSVGLGYNL